MPWRINCIFLAFLCLYGFTIGELDKPSQSQFIPRTGKDYVFPSNWKGASSTGNIKFDDDASGMGAYDFSDDEDLAGSGSGSGSGAGVISDTEVNTTYSTTVTTTSTISSRPPTHCELNYQSGKAVSGLFVPRCLPNGDYDSLQCHGYPGTSQCYCSDLDGRQIPGTLMEPPKFPNCESGQNLNPCIFLSVKHIRSKLVGAFRPKCTIDGNFEKVQCHGSMCYCVDEASGIKVPGSEVHIPDVPNCDDEELTPAPTPKSTKDEPSIEEEGKIDIDDPTDNTPKPETEESSTLVIDEERNVNIDQDKSKEKEENIEDNKTGIGHNSQTSVEKASSEIMTQPGILAGIIGGSVVVLLCVVLLIMFLIYRMRKKDEGSYPLDEPRKPPNYSYVRAPEKEFYA